MSVWRSFKFFDSEVLKSPLCRMEITCCCYGHKAVFVGDSEGFVYAVDRGSSTTLLEFPAYKGAVTHMKHLRSRNVLITIGDDDALNTCIMRVWNLDTSAATAAAPTPTAGRGGGGGQPNCREHRLFTPKNPPPANSVALRTNYNPEVMQALRFKGREADTTGGIPATAFRTVVVHFDVSEDLQNAAVALVSDEIIALRGDVERDPGVKIRRIRSSVARGAIVFVGFPGARFATRTTRGIQQVFGVGTSGKNIDNTGKNIRTSDASAVHVMYTVFTDAVTVWQVTPAAVFTEHPCNPPFDATPDCSCCMTDDGQLIVASATSDQVAVFGSEAVLSPAACTSTSLPLFDPTLFGAVHFSEVPGRKLMIVAHRSYAVVLTQSDTRPAKFTLQCYDLVNRLRCLSRSQENCCSSNVAWVLADTTDILVVSQELSQQQQQHRLVRLTEVPLQSRLEQLFQKECYDVAKRLARRLHTTDATQQMIIQKKYGDYLVSKGKYAEAIDQYIEAIGFVEPSYVIRIFVNGQHTAHLTRYLEELHHKRHGNIANRSHTTLLLNCYIKLHEETKLLAFIHRDDIHFDAHNAIRVCRQAGYYDAALYLAEKYAQPHDHVLILLENLHNPQKALSFIQTLCVDDAEVILRQQGKGIADVEPRRCTEVLVELCVRWKGPARRLADPAAIARGATPQPLQQHRLAHRSEAKDFMHVFVDSPVSLLYFLRAVVESGVLDDEGDSQRVVYNTLLELYMTRDLRPSIRRHAVSRDTELFTVEPHERRLQQALTFLETYAGKFDDYHALALAEQHGFEDGVLLLLRRLGLSSDIMQYYAKGLEEGSTPDIRKAAKKKLIETCRSLVKSSSSNSNNNMRDGGDNNKSDESAKELWMSLLLMLVRSPDTEWQDLVQVLDILQQQQDLLSPLSVVAILRTNPRLELRTVREYVLRMMGNDTQRAEVSMRLAETHRKKLHKLQTEIDALQTKAVVFQAHTCSHCHSALDLPVVHFMCQHSFHQRCLNDVVECNLCAPIHQRLIAEQIQEEKDAKPEEFFRRLALAGDADGFSVVAEQFSKCIFAAPPLRREATLFSGDPMVPGSRAAATGAGNGDYDGGSISGDDEVYNEEGELLRPEAVELW